MQLKEIGRCFGTGGAVENAMLCPMMIPDVDYTSEETVASDLKGFIRLSRGYVIETNDWEAVFGDPNPTIHRLYSKEYMWDYFVYKTDSEWETINGIFDLTNVCWLNINNE